VQYFPNTTADGEGYEGLVATAEEAEDDGEVKRLKAEWQENSLLGRTGHALEPAFAPLGWDWKIGMATLASFPAREVIVGTLRILYQADEPEDGQPDTLGEEIGKGMEEKLRVPIALSVMVFFALCAQCASTLAVIRRETRSWRWPLFSFAYMTVLAYLGALVTFQVGKLLVGAG
jgi:ferrous iron transport protein B